MVTFKPLVYKSECVVVIVNEAEVSKICTFLLYASILTRICVAAQTWGLWVSVCKGT